jgi:hypothetical protein
VIDLALLYSTLSWAFGFQETRYEEIKKWIQSLSSEQVTERNDGQAKLVALKESCIPMLEEAAKGQEFEVVLRLHHIGKVIRIRSCMSPRLLLALPGIEERLAGGTQHDWTISLLQASELRCHGR